MEQYLPQLAPFLVGTLGFALGLIIALRDTSFANASQLRKAVKRQHSH
jgi:hypothetical protein